jgi:hypothetical protein
MVRTPSENEDRLFWKPRSTPDCTAEEEEEEGEEEEEEKKEKEIRLKLLEIESKCAHYTQSDCLQLLFQQASTSPHYFF